MIQTAAEMRTGFSRTFSRARRFLFAVVIGLVFVSSIQASRPWFDVERLRFTYRGEGDLLTLTDWKNQVTQWQYDDYGRLTNMVDAVGTTAFTYTSFGALLSEDGPWADDRIAYDCGRQRERRGGRPSRKPGGARSFERRKRCAVVR